MLDSHARAAENVYYRVYYRTRAMTVSFRLDDELARQLEAAARKHGVSKSEYVRQCLADRLAREGSQPTAWELGRHLFGRYRSGRRRSSEKSERIVREKIRARANRR
jgi:predicted transcriptional regulator